jgi:pimeloyl-ACP methyl ester carboxylesterase
MEYTDKGAGAPVLLLHGGGGPSTVATFADLLAEQRRVITPVHPGFDGTPRPNDVAKIADLAHLYADLLNELDLQDVTVVGNSIGGWIAAELALLGSDRVGRGVLVNAVGLLIENDPIADFFSLTMDQVTDLSYYRPDAFRFDPTTLPPERQAIVAANRETLRTYAGDMSDPTLLDRLSTCQVPVLVVWGAADRIVSPAHGRAYAERIPDARFELIPDAGHMPQLETPEKLAELITGFRAA